MILDKREFLDDMFLLVQYDDREITQFEKLIEKNKEYCKKRNIEYRLLQKGYETYPPWWRKVFLVAELLPFYEGILWLDTDAVVVGEKHFSEYFEDKHFVFSPNPPPAYWNPSFDFLTAPLCAGIWAVKNTPEGNLIMSTWKKAYDPSKWRTEKGVWKGDGLYAGINYEQGSFECSIFRVQDMKNLTKMYPFYVFNYLAKRDNELIGKECFKETFSIHYWSGQRSQISSHWK